MRAKSRFMLLVFSVALLLAPQVAGSDDDGFGSNVAGAWLGSGFFSFDGNCDGEPDNPDPGARTYFTDLQSFGAGGLYVALNPNNPNSSLGTWEKTGPRQISGQAVVFINLDPANPAGGLLFVARIPIVVDFNRDFETATSTFGAVLYNPAADPLDPDQKLFCTAGQHTSLRKVSPSP